MMPGDGKGSALAEIAGALSSSGRPGPERDAEKGSAGAHTPDSPENFAERDLFLSFDDEVADFAGHAIGVPAKRGAGRPPGSVNRTTKQLQAWLRGRGYRDPAEFLAAIVTVDARQLAYELKGKPVDETGAPRPVTFDEAMEVAKLQKAAAAELMPYFHQRTPQQVEQVGDGARPLILIMQRNQGVNARVIDGSHGAGSHDGGQAADVSRETGEGADD